jgi:hypothetical protein
MYCGGDMDKDMACKAGERDQNWKSKKAEKMKDI